MLKHRLGIRSALKNTDCWLVAQQRIRYEVSDSECMTVTSMTIHPRDPRTSRPRPARPEEILRHAYDLFVAFVNNNNASDPKPPAYFQNMSDYLAVW